ncbi:MAG: IS21 family transposase [Planctomycetes bacterium]|nr:IS21 family transposase [Planctomycetota bacterium]
MITPELEAKILRLFDVEKWRVGTIGTQLDVHRTVVQRVLAQAGRPKTAIAHQSRIDPFLPVIESTLQTYPTLSASRLYQMVRERGYDGGPDHFRHFIAMHRPKRPAEAFARLSTVPGEQGQVDWGHFGTLQIGRAMRQLLAFVLVLSWSRRIFLRFFLGGVTANFLRGHVAAFEAFGGVPRHIIYDNLKSAVLERRGDAVRYNPQLLDFARHYQYELRAAAVARGNEKGRVERAIGYIRKSFFLGRTFRDLDDLNAQAETWSTTVAMARRAPQDEAITVAEAFAREQPYLLPLPGAAFPAEDRVEVSVGKTPYARFDCNDYSVPHDRVRRVVVVRATTIEVRIFDGDDLIASHRRSYDRRVQIEDPAHVLALKLAKQAAGASRGVDRLRHAVPQSQELLRRLADRNANIGSETTQLMRLLDEHGAQRLGAAITEALHQNVVHHHGVRHILERDRIQRGSPPPLPVPLPDDPRVRDVSVRPHDLGRYDEIGKIGEEAGS